MGATDTPVVAIPEEGIRLRLDDDLVSAMSAPAVRHADLVLVVPHSRHILSLRVNVGWGVVGGP